MKAKETETGKVYAYREGRHLYDHVYQVVFLAPVTDLYTYNERSHAISRSAAAKPKARSFYPSEGYLVAVGRDVSGASLEDALVKGVSWGVMPDFNYRILTNMAAVLGPYEETVAAVEAERQALQDQRERDQKFRDDLAARLGEVKEELAKHGVRAYVSGNTVEILESEALKLMELLRARP